MTTTYRKTATIEATQWFKMGDHPAVVLKSDPNRYADEGVAWCPTMEGGHIVTPGDWIATGIKGEHWPIKPDVFAETYTPVDAALSTPATEPQGYVEGLRAASARCKLEAEICRNHGPFRNEASELYFDGLQDAQIIIDRLADEAARPAPQPAAEHEYPDPLIAEDRYEDDQPAADTPAMRDELATMISDLSHTGELSMLYRMEIADRITALRAIIGNATPTPSDKIAEAARVPDLDPVQVGEISNYYGGLWIKAADGVPYWSIEDYSGDTWEVCPMPVFAALRALAGKGE